MVSSYDLDHYNLYHRWVECFIIELVDHSQLKPVVNEKSFKVMSSFWCRYLLIILFHAGVLYK